MSEHNHSHGSGKTLAFALVFTTGFAIVELVGGLWSGSLALLSDAGHMLTDSLSLGVGAFAAWLATKPASRKHSFGLQRAEVLGALFNVIFMFAVVAYIVYEAIRRMADPPEVIGGAVLLIGGLGLLVNITVAWLLMRGEQTMNVRGALLHVMGDLLGSVAALAAGAIIYLGGPLIVDPLLSLFVSLLILASAGRLLREVTRVLMEGVPRDVDASEVASVLIEVTGVRAVHDMHIWTLSSKTYALAAHVDLDAMAEWQQALPQLQMLLRERFDITHSTLQPEDESIRKTCDAAINCGAPNSKSS
ncbi:cation diffusion facilitator family transporter [Salinisphaera sp. P385]|uniref:Cation diffusion facilitator family transporter n=1 Tax=Spectribacter acetivorans TaxID=3075603 RepID=A0ABU3B7C7_9GAMM|nr:cation diffusion facilitator family transporter [Salinisphaera sp. P385]MDT0618370.1 cation diffusion facilitator family transporter [Salinisphaera sp. P385]